MIFNFQQSLNEVVELQGSPNWLIAIGVAIVFGLVGVTVAMGDADTESGPVIFKAGGAALVGFFVAAFISSGFSVAKSNFVAHYGHKP